MASYNSEAPVLDTYQAVVSAYCDFLTVAIHTILYERNIYPQTSFLKARKYNYPVRQSRHPRVCKWIMDAVAAVEGEMLKVGRSLLRLVLFIYWDALPTYALSHSQYIKSKTWRKIMKTSLYAVYDSSIHRALYTWCSAVFGSGDWNHILN
jgi:hypothetical protein